MKNGYKMILLMLLAVGGFLYFGQTVYAEGEPEWSIGIDETNFPDINFRTYLKDQNFGKDGILTKAEMESVTSIDVYEANITSLEGIQYFQMLEELICPYNAGLTGLKLGNLTHLKKLECDNTGINSLDVSNNTQLQWLTCNNIPISNLDLSKNTDLEGLICNDIAISSLDVSKNEQLQHLSCNNTSISSLDVSKNAKLQTLDCNDTNISSLDVTKNMDLQYLNCDNMNISSLDVSQNLNLQWLSCSNTKISSLDVSKNTQLSEFYMSNCKTQVLLSSGNTIEVSQLPDFDINKVSDVQNATLSEGKFIVKNPSDSISYTYDCGGGNAATFMLEINRYAITYELNSGTLSTKNPKQYQAGDRITFYSPERKGYTFAGWYKENTFLTPVAETLDTTQLKEPLTLYAKWEPVPITTYAITYDANGGTGQMAEGTATKDIVFTLPQNGFTAPSGKQFKEWAIGSIDGTKVKAGGTYTFTEATTIYAVWESIPETVIEAKKATFKELQLKAKAGKTTNKLTWKKIKGADGYVVYGAKKGKKLKKVKDITKGVSYTHKKLSKKAFYQYQVKAYRLVDGKQKFVSISQKIYSVTTGGKYDNPKKVTVKASKVTIKKGKSKTIKAKIVKSKRKKLRNYTKAFRYETTNPKIATVSSKGKVKAKAKGSCSIYVYAQNGISKKISVRVK